MRHRDAFVLKLANLLMYSHGNALSRMTIEKYHEEVARYQLQRLGQPSAAPLLEQELRVMGISRKEFLEAYDAAVQEAKKWQRSN